MVDFYGWIFRYEEEEMLEDEMVDGAADEMGNAAPTVFTDTGGANAKGKENAEDEGEGEWIGGKEGLDLEKDPYYVLGIGKSSTQKQVQNVV